MAFLTEPEPVRDLPLPVVPGIRRIVAANPGPLTGHGTNTWLIDSTDGAVVIDPGPPDPMHVQAILRATGGRIARILVSHRHRGHLGALGALRAITGALSYGCADAEDRGFVPDFPLREGDGIAGLAILHTPGHAPDHLCFARADGVIFTGDQVLTCAASSVIPPTGDMAAYLASLARLAARDDRLLLPGHGPPLVNPRPYVQELLAHWRRDEAEVLAAIAAAARTPAALVALKGGAMSPALRAVAESVMLAHLQKLAAEGRALEDATGAWHALPQEPDGERHAQL
jgi:glyoxylase-like metal-dependent hydrolase (beta-lactamase superfamily II)